MINLQDYFIPNEKIKALRSNQIQAAKEISLKLEAGVRFIELEAPPGSGKSELAKLIMNYAEANGLASLVCSPQNVQVDQYQNMQFEGLVTLKGRSHYPCVMGKLNCAEGFCQSKKCYDNKTKRNHCKTKDLAICKACHCKDCIYTKQFKAFRGSMKANTNFTLFLIGITNQPDLLIIDEADTIESEIRKFKSVTVNYIFDKPVFPDIIQELKIYCDDIEALANALRLLQVESVLTETQHKDLERYEEILDNVWYIINDFGQFKEPWCISEKKHSGKTKFEPITIERFLNPLFGNKIVIMMSATPPHYPGFEKIVVDSIFPIESRQWIYKPEYGSMTSKCRDNTIPRLAAWLSKLKGKTMFHSRSYETGLKLKAELFRVGSSCFLQEKDNGNGGYTRYDIVDAFLKSSNSSQIAILTNQTRGLDVWQPEVINNILTMPWINPTEPITKAKDAVLGTAWRDQEMANEIAQTIARHFRNEKMGVFEGVTVPKRAIIADASFGNWYIKNKKLFPKNFIESERL